MHRATLGPRYCTRLHTSALHTRISPLPSTHISKLVAAGRCLRPLSSACSRLGLHPPPLPAPSRSLLSSRAMSTSSPSLPSTMKAVRIHEYGDSSALTYEDVSVPSPSPTQVLVEVHHAGINYIDTYHRSGLYPNPLPLTIGREGAGVVVQVGAEVKDIDIGQLVVFFAQGAYAEYVAVDASAIVQLPSDVTTATAAAAYLQGLTAHYLTSTTYPIKQGNSVLVHAAAGGTGALVVQMAKLRGASTIIGTVGSEAKAAVARSAGCTDVVLYTDDDFLVEVKKITHNAGCHVVYDGVGAATWERSLKSLRKLGYLVLFGNASGPVPPINPLELSKHGSIFLTRPTLGDYIADRAALEWRAKELFGWIAEEKVHLTIAKTLPLSEAKQGHELLESRGVSGKIILEVKKTA